ncbi:MAG: tyrosine-type recombinase/integrase, partial [Alphaproteobacteria bacterium]|nr:tyrosine-type recombinase/integrase [Alphaproteobacteria bacterium]
LELRFFRDEREGAPRRPARWAWNREGPAISENTERALRSDLAIFAAWCAERGAEAMPASAETAAAFVDDMAKVRAPATVRRYIASIASAHRAIGHGDTLRSVPVRLALQRMQRCNGDRQVSAEGLTWQLCQRLMQASGDRLIDLRNRALLAVAYDAMLRRADLTSLLAPDLLDEGWGGALLRVRSGKAGRKDRDETVRIAPDTLRLVHAWLSTSGIAEGYLFRSVDKGGRLGERLDPSRVPRIFKAMAQEAVLPEAAVKRLSGDSPRIGAVQDIIAAGVDLPAILEAGPWKSVAAAEGQPRRRSGALRLVRLLQGAGSG